MKKIEFKDGTYEGEVRGDMRHGMGKMTYNNGNIYEGEWKNDKRHGKGKFTYPNGTYYEGEYENEIRSGNGVCTYPDGSKYVGAWKLGLRDGVGTMEFSNGKRYHGGWVKNKMQGEGRYEWSENAYYLGNFHEGAFSGAGIRVYPDGSKYEGEFKADKRSGKGKLTLPDGTELVGEWTDERTAHNAERYGKVTVVQQGRVENGEFISNADVSARDEGRGDIEKADFASDLLRAFDGLFSDEKSEDVLSDEYEALVNVMTCRIMATEENVTRLAAREYAEKLDKKIDALKKVIVRSKIDLSKLSDGDYDKLKKEISAGGEE
jgi:hypothetical protein